MPRPRPLPVARAAQPLAAAAILGRPPRIGGEARADDATLLARVPSCDVSRVDRAASAKPVIRADGSPFTPETAAPASPAPAHTPAGPD